MKGDTVCLLVGEIITEHKPTTVVKTGKQLITPISRKRVWNCQLPKTFRVEMLRIIKSHNRNNAPISKLTVIYRNGVAVDVQIPTEALASGEQEHQEVQG